MRPSSSIEETEFIHAGEWRAPQPYFGCCFFLAA
jgi:hypothetical protein